jgi:hypothetical protein
MVSSMRTLRGLARLVKGWSVRRAGGASILLVLSAACDSGVRQLPFRFVEKGPYQALYGPDGRIERILLDADGDRRAEAVCIYAPTGTIARCEIDTDGDGVVDRREEFGPEGPAPGGLPPF